MIYSLYALMQIFIPFLILLTIFGGIYIFSIRIRNLSLKDALKKDLAHLINVASILLVFVTLLEMQLERIETYKPYIVLEAGTGGSTYTINEGINSEHQYAIFSTNYSNPNLSGDVKIPIKNIGVGVAKNLKMTFTIDFKANSERYFQFENKYFSFSLEKYKSNNTIEVDNRYMTNNTFLSSPDIHIPDEQVYYQSFILPNNQETLYVKLPIDYLSAVRHYIVYSHDIDVPPLYLTISYEDVQGIKYSQNFLLSLSSQFSIDYEKKEYTIYYTFTPEENKQISYGGSAQSEFPEPYDYSISANDISIFYSCLQ